MEKVSIVITNWNGAKIIRNCLESVRRAAGVYNSPVEIIVVDDASSDESREIIKSEFPEVKLLVNEKNLGYGGTATRGIRESKYNISILLNNDVEVKEDFISPLVPYFDDSSIFAVSSRSFFNDKKTFNEGHKKGEFVRGFIRFSAGTNGEPSKDIIEKKSSFYSFYAVGGHCAYSREKFLLLEGINSIYYPLYWEDVDICYRAWKRGWKTVYEPKSIVYHESQGTLKESYKKKRAKILMNRNRILLVWMNCELKTIFKYHFFPMLWKILTYFIILDFDFYRSFILAVSKIPDIQRERKKENKDIVITDREIFQLCQKML
ncbi:MAG: glycosyltransferase family 2 protein [bacterium]|nr:glycosyltransferase family 2 protein [bacterium]